MNRTIISLFILFFFLNLSADERTEKIFAMCVSRSAYQDCYLVQVIIAESRKGILSPENPPRMELDERTLEPILDKKLYEMTVRRFLLETERSYQISSSEFLSGETRSFSFQGKLTKRTETSFCVEYAYKEDNLSKDNLNSVLAFQGNVQLELNQIFVLGRSLREEKEMPARTDAKKERPEKNKSK